MKRLLPFLALAAVTVLSVFSCQQDPEEIRVSSISLSKSTLELTVGDQASLDATISPDNATNKKISWNSSKESVATVTPDGIVEAVSAGTAFITARSEDSGVNAKCEITVKEKVISVTRIFLNKTSLSLTEGEEFTLEATVTPDNATNKEVTWTSDNEAVATVSAEGIVKAIKAGTANITATTVDQGKSASCAVVVAAKMSAVTGEATHISCRNAKLSGNVTLPQTTSPYISFGVLYSTSSAILLGSATLLEAKEPDAENYFTVDSGVLEPETTYYYRSYIIDDYGVSYGQIKSFKTLAVSSMIQTHDAVDVYPKEATLNATLDLTDCNYSNIEYGFELIPEGGPAKTLTANNLADKAFSYRDETLSRNTGYSYVAYVKLDGILYKAEPKTFTTTSIQAFVTAEASKIQYHSATISGSLSVQSEGSFSKSAVLYYGSSESTLDGLKSNGTRKTLTLGADGSYTAALSSLSYSTSYNYIVVAKVDDVEFASSIGNFTTPAPPEPSLVDLGLSVKWASFNLGASKPSEYGGYYQWAGTKDVSDTGIYLDWDNCPYHTGSNYSSGWTKYNTQSSYGIVDNKTVLEPMDDAATVALGGKWRIPTDTEWSELRNTSNCSWTWTTIDGVIGYKVQSKKPGYTDNWIFLPAAGRRNDDNLNLAGSDGSYWSSSLHTDDTDSAYGMGFYSSYVRRYYRYRYYGRSIRPVSE